jgi:hypothetical protein
MPRYDIQSSSRQLNHNSYSLSLKEKTSLAETLNTKIFSLSQRALFTHELLSGIPLVTGRYLSSFKLKCPRKHITKRPQVPGIMRLGCSLPQRGSSCLAPPAHLQRRVLHGSRCHTCFQWRPQATASATIAEQRIPPEENGDGERGNIGCLDPAAQV